MVISWKRERDLHTFNIWSCAMLPKNFLFWEKATRWSKNIGKKTWYSDQQPLIQHEIAKIKYRDANDIIKIKITDNTFPLLISSLPKTIWWKFDNGRWRVAINGLPYNDHQTRSFVYMDERKRINLRHKLSI